MVYLFLADGFEITEAVFPVDLLRRAKIGVRTVGIGGAEVCSSAGIAVRADLAGGGFELPQDAEMVVLPGGMPGTVNLLGSSVVRAALAEAKRRDLFCAAICAAPRVLDANGLLDGRRATMFPDMSGQMLHGQYTGAPVERDGRVITARAVGVAQEFGLALIEALRGKEVSEQVRRSVYPNF